MWRFHRGNLLFRGGGKRLHLRAVVIGIPGRTIQTAVMHIFPDDFSTFRVTGFRPDLHRAADTVFRCKHVAVGQFAYGTHDRGEEANHSVGHITPDHLSGGGVELMKNAFARMSVGLGEKPLSKIRMLPSPGLPLGIIFGSWELVSPPSFFVFQVQTIFPLSLSMSWTSSK